MQNHPKPEKKRRLGLWSTSACARSAISSAVCCSEWKSLLSISSPGLSGGACIKPSPKHATGKDAASGLRGNEKLNCRGQDREPRSYNAPAAPTRLFMPTPHLKKSACHQPAGQRHLALACDPGLNRA